jgi:thiol-disulfide isomerase/thioredoxin
MRPALLLAVLLLALTGCAAADEAAASGTDFLADELRQDRPPAERPEAPPITGTSLEGEPIDLTAAEGPVVVNFWASWCGPCVSEAPHLAAISDEFADEGVRVVGVNLDTSETNARTFQRDHELPFPSISDPSKRVAAAFGRQGPAGLPTTIILDSQGRVASRMLGAVTAAELALRLNGLLQEAEPGEAGGG